MEDSTDKTGANNNSNAANNRTAHLIILNEIIKGQKLALKSDKVEPLKKA